LPLLISSPPSPADQRKQDLELLQAAPPDDAAAGGGRSLMPYAKDADDADADADDDDSSSDEVRATLWAATGSSRGVGVG
jgi:hypothetical protein